MRSEIKLGEEAFTRNRKLNFKTVLELLLRKSVKSLQVILNEFTFNLPYRITASALSQARNKLSHTAFIELLERTVIEPTYSDKDNFITYKKRRLLAIDGTTLVIPRTEETVEHFGVEEFLSSKSNNKSNQVEAKASVIYDVLNNIPISAKLFRGRTNDMKASYEHLDVIKGNDIILADRGYVSYQFFNKIKENGADFIVRMKSSVYRKYHDLYENTKRKEVLIEIELPKRLENVSKSIKLRLIKVILDDGEIEILATSLIDKNKYPYKHFKTLYKKRWEIETHFNLLKSRLCLNNFTGQTVESIYQDFYSTIFLSGLETILVEEANEELEEKDTEYLYKVNKAISFHAIKSKLISLIFNPPKDFKNR